MKPAPSVPLSDVEWRVDSKPKDGKARFVPHINARIAAALMDEWVGPENWKDAYRVATIAGKEAVVAEVSVYVGGSEPSTQSAPGIEVTSFGGSGQWVTKTDVGVASQTEPQKGAVSDAFKRVVSVKWGAGRNVYDLPTLWAPCREWNEKAYPNDQTQPSILAQLKARGFDATGVRFEDSENAGASGERPAPAEADSTHSAGQSHKNKRAQLKSRASALVADGVSVADARQAVGLPAVDKSNADELERWDGLLADLEATLERPFVETPA